MNLQQDKELEVSQTSPVSGSPRRRVFLFSGLVLLAVVLAFSVFYSSKLSTRAYLRPIRVTVSPTELTQDESLLVIWEENKESKQTHPTVRLVACGLSGACQTLAPSTPNDGKEQVSVSTFAPGRYAIEVRALDMAQEEVPTLSDRSDTFTVQPRTQ